MWHKGIKTLHLDQGNDTPAVMISLTGLPRPVITPSKTVTHTQAHRLSRLAVSRDHTKSQLSNTTSPHRKISKSLLVALPPVTSNLLPPPSPLPPPPSLLSPQPLSSDNSRLERLDPKGCPPLDRKSHPSNQKIIMVSDVVKFSSPQQGTQAMT